MLESRLLEQSVFYQLADSKGLSAMESVLNATAYGKQISVSNFDEEIEGQEYVTLQELKSIVKDFRFLLPFLYKKDFHNLKLIAKSKFVHVDTEWLKDGLLEKELASRVISNGDISPLPKNYRNFVNGAWEIYEDTGWFDEIEFFLERNLYGEIFKNIEGLSFLEDFFRIEADLLNIRSFLRSRSQSMDKEIFLRRFFNGGALSKDFFAAVYEQQVNVFSGRLKFTPYSFLSEEAISYTEKTGEFYKVEQGCQSVLIDYLSGAKYTAFGYEPVFRYAFLKMNELRNLRTVFLGKLHGAEPEKVKERLGPFYA